MKGARLEGHPSQLPATDRAHDSQPGRHTQEDAKNGERCWRRLERSTPYEWIDFCRFRGAENGHAAMTRGADLTMKRRQATRGRLRRSICGVLIGFMATTAQAADRNLSIELNKLEPHGSACRAYLVLENKTGARFKTLKLDLVMFDTGGIIAKRLAVEAAPLPVGKTSLKVFDIGGLPCEVVGRVLLNDVMACADASGERDDCLDLVVPASRGPVDLIK